MKLNIAQMTPARVVFPVRLQVRSEDLPAFQAATLSHRAFVDATIDLGPEDFPNDAERLAARDLAALIRSENHRDNDYYYDPTGQQVVAGMLAIEIAYPFEEADIRQAAIDLIGKAMGQQEFVATAFADFEAWTKKVELTLRTTAKALLKKHKKALSKFDALQLRRKAAVQSLNQEELLAFVSAYRELAQEIPSEEDVQSTFEDAIPSGSLPFQPKYLRFRLHSSRLMAVMEMNRSATTRTASSEPTVSIAIHLVGADDHFGCEAASLDCRMTIQGSLIERKEKSSEAAFSELEPLMTAVYQVREDWGRYGKAFNEDGMPADISEAMKRIEAKAIVDEMDTWIRNYGSPSLKLGHEQKFSMTRQYRLERAQSVLAHLLEPYPGWALVLSGDIAEGTRSAEKASPSARALNALVGIKAVAPGATIHYSPALTDETLPEDGEYLWIPADQCFPDAPGIAICWPLPAPVKKGPKRRP